MTTSLQSVLNLDMISLQSVPNLEMGMIQATSIQTDRRNTRVLGICQSWIIIRVTLDLGLGLVKVNKL